MVFDAVVVVAECLGAVFTDHRHPVYLPALSDLTPFAQFLILHYKINNSKSASIIAEYSQTEYLSLYPNYHILINNMEAKRISTTTNPIKINTLGMDIDLPEGASVSPYQIKNEKKLSKNAKQKQKYSHFSYYKLKDSTIVKILFLTAETYIEISRFPFIKSSDVTEVKNFKELNDSGATRLVTAEALLIGTENNKAILVKKLETCKISENDAEVDTVEDVFESLPVANKERYNYVLSSLKEIKMASLRVIINEQGDKAEILDFDYFFAEREFSKKHTQTSTEKSAASTEQKVKVKQEKKEEKKEKKQKKGKKEEEAKEKEVQKVEVKA